MTEEIENRLAWISRRAMNIHLRLADSEVPGDGKLSKHWRKRSARNWGPSAKGPSEYGAWFHTLGSSNK